jgi:Transposase IS66 family
VVYDFTWSRNRDGPLKMLAGHRGYLQVDAAPAYDDVFVQYPEIIEVGCMAHARRYFKEALPTAAVPCAQALALIKQMYGIERAASDKRLDARPHPSDCGRNKRGRSWRDCMRICRSSGPRRYRRVRSVQPSATRCATGSP